MATAVHAVIQFLASRLELLPDDAARGFVRDMVAKLDKYGDTFFCSWKQRRFLDKLYRGLLPTEPEKPKSRLEELRERKAKILQNGSRRRKLARKATNADAANILRVMKDITDNSLTAKMRHDRSTARQFGTDPRSRRGKKAKEREGE